MIVRLRTIERLDGKTIREGNFQQRVSTFNFLSLCEPFHYTHCTSDFQRYLGAFDRRGPTTQRIDAPSTGPGKSEKRVPACLALLCSALLELAAISIGLLAVKDEKRASSGAAGNPRQRVTWEKWQGEGRHRWIWLVTGNSTLPRI